MTTNHEALPEPPTIEQVLKSAVGTTNRLYREAQTALWKFQNPTHYRNALTERGRIIERLPVKIGKLVEQGQSIPEEELEELNNLAFLAQEALEGQNVFRLGVFLTERGSKSGDPNLLEQIVNRLYPPKSS